MPRLLIVTTVASTVKGFLLPIARHFRARGWTVDALATGITDCAECISTFDHIWEAGWSRNPLSPGNLSLALARVRSVVVQGQYDIVHVHTPVASFCTRLALHQLRRRGVRPAVIYTAHGFHFHSGGTAAMNVFASGLERIAARWTDYLVVINREDFDAASRLSLVPGERLMYMPGIGLDTTVYSRDAVPTSTVAALRGELGLAENQPLFLMIAAFDRGKRHADALRAFAMLSRSEPSARLAFAGRGRRRQACEQLAASLGLADHVHFLGYRSDIPALIRASTATLLPSEREGLPRSVMESLSLEVPVIGSDARGIRDLLADGSGLMSPVGDIEGLAGAMAWILRHPQEAELMGRRGRDRLIADGKDQENILSLHEELYSMAMEGRRAC